MAQRSNELVERRSNYATHFGPLPEEDQTMKKREKEKAAKYKE
jgi:hypothetical protein